MRSFMPEARFAPPAWPSALRGLRMALLAAVVSGLAPGAWGAPASNEPHLGYLWPAGGRQGSVMRVWVGGQRLAGMNRIYVSGQGVQAKVIWYAPSLNGDDFEELRRRREERAKPKETPPAKDAAAADAKPEPRPNNPLIDVLDALTDQELQTVLSDFYNPYSKRQPNAQLSETAFVEITIDATAPPGDREVRVGCPAGLTNAMCFQVSTFPEVFEVQQFGVIKRPTPVLEAPVVANGQVTPGDVDRYPVRARRGQRLVIEAHARRLNPYLADAVPGWFQAVLTLYDPKGKPVAFADDYRFDPDPVLLYEVPEDGDYSVEIRDSIYRGREDFVYRISVTERPFVTRLFPLGGREGAEAPAAIDGWNLPAKEVRLDTRPGGERIRWLTLPAGTAGPANGPSNAVPYAVDTLPEVLEKERNNSTRDAQPVAPPVTLNGVVERPGDVDVYRFEGRAGDPVVVEVLARRLGSPLNSIVRLLDASGRTLAWNDDRKGVAAGLITHQADSFLSARLPKSGAYFVAITDADGHGDEFFAYRLRIGPPRHDFALVVTPASANVPGSGLMPLTVYARRDDGFDGDIELALKDAPAGFKLSGGWIPHGRSSACVTLAVPPGKAGPPFTLRLEGRARIGDAVVTREAAPAQEMMQAFAYWHQVPVQEMVVDTPRDHGAPSELAGEGPVRLPAGSSARVEVKVPWRWALPNVELEAVDPPKGVSLGPVGPNKENLVFVVKADAALKPGYADNLVVEAFGKGEKGGRYSLGLLPAIPFEVVQW